MVIRPLKKRFSIFRGRVVRVLKGSTKKSERRLLDFLVGYLYSMVSNSQCMCHAMINLLHNCQYSILGVRHAWEATYFRPIQFTQISLKLNPIFLQIFYISSLTYKAKYFIDELLFLSFISSHVKF